MNIQVRKASDRQYGNSVSLVIDIAPNWILTIIVMLIKRIIVIEAKING